MVSASWRSEEATLFALIVDRRNGVRASEVIALGRSLQGSTSPLRTVPAEISAPPQEIGAAVRVPGFLPEDRYDRQPLWSPETKTWFVCQVRLDNREELLHALEMNTLPAAEIADSSILFCAYQRWGEQAVAHLVGDYAFAAYSAETQTLFAAVDHLGHHRLYYTAREGRIVLSTQLAALRDHEKDVLAVDPIALGLSAEARYVPGRTPFLNIHQVPGGESLRWTAGGSPEVRRWWQPRPQIARLRDPGEYLDAVQEVFTQAVRSCLRSVVPVGTTLSGGLDSGLVTTTAARLLAEQGASLKAFTSAPALENPVFFRRGWDADDAPFAVEVAALHPNLEHIILRTGERAALDLLPQIHQSSATPVRNGSNHLWMNDIARCLGPGVLLTGARGNFSVSYSGMGGTLELLRTWQLRAFVQHGLATQRAEGRPLWKTILRVLQPRAIRDFRNRSRAEIVEYLSLTTTAFQEEHRQVLHPQRPEPGTRASLTRSMTLPNYVWMADPLPMWGTEWRDPTADRRLLELLLSFPLAAFAHHGADRGLARTMGQGLLPDAVRLRRTRGGQSMDYAAVMGRALSRYQDACDRMAASSACRSLFDLDKLRASLERVRAGETSGALTSPIDRCIDAGIFLLEQEAS